MVAAWVEDGGAADVVGAAVVVERSVGGGAGLVVAGVVGGLGGVVGGGDAVVSGVAVTTTLPAWPCSVQKYVNSPTVENVTG